jgi:hypothetical protein
VATPPATPMPTVLGTLLPDDGAGAGAVAEGTSEGTSVGPGKKVVNSSGPVDGGEVETVEEPCVALVGVDLDVVGRVVKGLGGVRRSYLTLAAGRRTSFRR